MKAYDLEVTGSLRLTGSLLNSDGTSFLTGSNAGASASLSTRLSTLETSGSITESSASFSTRVTTNEASGALFDGDGSPTFSDLTVTGRITAEQFQTKFVSASIALITGSNVFGDDISDTHRFTGSLLMTGSAIVGTGKGITPLGDFDVSVNEAGSRRFTVSFEDSLVSLSAKNGSNNGEVLKLMGDDLVIHTGTDTSGTEKMRIDTSGNVGIGTNNPGTNLHLYTSTSAHTTLKIETDTDNQRADINLDGRTTSNQAFAEIVGLNNGDSVGAIAFNRDGANDAGNISFTTQKTGGSMTERMRINSSGDVGIGTDNPGSMIHLHGTDPIVRFQDSAGGDVFGIYNSDSLGLGFFNFTDSRQDLTISGDGSTTFSGSMKMTKAGNLRLEQEATGTGEASIHLHANNTTGDSFIRFETEASTRFAMGIDNSDEDKFIFSLGGDPHSDSIFNIQADGSIITFDKATNVNNSLVVSPNGAKLGVGAEVKSGSTDFDVLQVGHTSQYMAETSNNADRNVYIGNNFYHDGSGHKPLYEDQVSGIQFRAGTIRLRSTGSVGTGVPLEGGGGRTRLQVHADGRVSVGYDQPGAQHVLEHNSALVVSSSGNSGPLSRNAMTVVGFCGAGSFNYGASTVTFDNIKGDGPCFTLRNLGSSHTDRGPFQVYNGSTRILETRNDGLISGDFNDTSDRDFKQNINTITSSLEQVNELRPVTFVWKQDEENGQNRGHGQTKIGFIAQEVSESIPRLVSGVSGSSSGLGINTIGVTAVLAKAVQELTDEIRFLRGAITGSSDLGQLKALVSGSSFV